MVGRIKFDLVEVIGGVSSWKCRESLLRKQNRGLVNKYGRGGGEGGIGKSGGPKLLAHPRSWA